MGLTFEKQLVYHTTLEKFGAARYIDFGGVLLGPTLIRYGTDSQIKEYLPDILGGKKLWCQGYSEPGAGSDLAGLSTVAARASGGYVLNGTKIWTTHASDADYMFLLARTRKSERKQDGISFFLLDMRSKGVEVRPIRNLAGESEFAQVFFTDVWVPEHNIVFEENKGWEVARSLLGTERITNGSPHLARKALSHLDQVAKVTRSDHSHAYRVTRAELAYRLHLAQTFYEEICEETIHGSVSPEKFSMMKVISSELFQDVSEALMDYADDFVGVVDGCEDNYFLESLHKVYMIARPGTIYSGTNEVQRNIISRKVIGS